MAYIGNPIYQSAFVTDTFSGNGSTTAFTMSVAPAGVSNVLIAISGVLQDPATYGVVGNTLNFSQAPPTGTNNISCRYLGVPATGVTTTAYRTQTEFTATAGQTTFTPPSYTVGFIDVYRNGALLGSADFTATNGTTVVLTNAASEGDLIETVSFLVSSVLNAIPATAGSVGSSNIVSGVTLTTPIVATTMGVGGATPSTSGSGITFPATQSASTNANTLDDYEEGTWTPVITALSGTITSFTSFGQYTKIGQLVVAQFQYNITNNGTGSVAIIINGLPFAGTVNTSGGLAREIAVIGVSGGAYLSGPTGMLIVTAAGAYMGGTGWVVVGTISYQV